MADYHKCERCGKKAQWMYMPNSNFYCDDCVPRGCSCNIDIISNESAGNGITPTIYYTEDDVSDYINGRINSDELLSRGSLTKLSDSVYYEVLDDQGRREPCCEYDYSYDGFEIEPNEY